MAGSVTYAVGDRVFCRAEQYGEQVGVISAIHDGPYPIVVEVAEPDARGVAWQWVEELKQLHLLEREIVCRLPASRSWDAVVAWLDEEA